MLYGSRISKKKVFHYGDCLYAKRIAFKNKTCFESVEEANNHGYTQCPCCSRIPAEYSKNRKSIQAFCTKYRMKSVLMDDELYIISKDDTAWRIGMKGDGSKEKKLLHESKRHVSYNRKKTPYKKREFHVQDIPSTSITGYLSYIRNHDACEAKREAAAAQAQAERACLKEQIKSIHAVQKQISKQNRKIKKRGPAESNAAKRRRSNQQLRDITRSFNDYRSAREAFL